MLSSSRRKVREARKKDNKCIMCGKNTPVPGLLGCDYCYSTHQEYIKELQDDRKALGFCIQCGEPVSEINPRTNNKYSRCKKHRAAQLKKLKQKRTRKHNENI